MGIRTYGLNAVDWEQRIDHDRLRQQRLARLQEALERSELGALLSFDFHNIRYMTSCWRRASGPGCCARATTGCCRWAPRTPGGAAGPPPAGRTCWRRSRGPASAGTRSSCRRCGRARRFRSTSGTPAPDMPVRWLETQAPCPPMRHSYRFTRDWDYLSAALSSSGGQGG
jgi:hypothetical protein